LSAPGQALDDALSLAHQLAAFPQRCLRSDLRSTKDQWSLSTAEALLHETLLGRETVASGETQAGAARFAEGAGRHGAPAD
jgi:enoyl-CoA hydratase